MRINIYIRCNSGKDMYNKERITNSDPIRVFWFKIIVSIGAAKNLNCLIGIINSDNFSISEFQDRESNY